MRSLLSLLILLGVGACANTVETSSSSTSGTGAGGKTSSTSGGNTSTATGPATSSSNTTTSGTSGTGGAGTCSGSTIDVAVDNGAPVHYSSICLGSWGANETTSAVAYEFSGGPPPGMEALRLVGCVSAAASSEGIGISLPNAIAAGSFITSTFSWTDSMGVQWGSPGDQLQADVTTLDSTGGVVEGKFQAFASHGGNAAHNLTGTFHLCHVSDELTP